MSQLHFFRDATPLTLSAVATSARAEIPDGADPARIFRSAASLNRAGADDVTVFTGAELDDLRATRAGACFVTETDRVYVPDHTIALVTERPLASFRLVVGAMYPRHTAPGPAFQQTGINPSAIVHAEANLEQGVIVDPGVVIGPRVEIGSGTRIGANSVIGPGVRVGRGCIIDSNVSIRAALIGDRVTVHAGARIGLGGPGTQADIREAAPRLGRVIIQDDVEIGANAAIERGNLGDTMVGEGSRIGTLAWVRAESIIDRHQTCDGGVFSSSSKMV